MLSRSGNKMAKLKTGIDGFGNLTVARLSPAQGAFSMARASLGARYKELSCQENNQECVSNGKAWH